MALRSSGYCRSGTLRNGEVFDSSIKAGQPVRFQLDTVIPCFAEGVTRMKVGGKSKLTCPPDTAYGDSGVPPMIRPGSALVFEIELLEIVGAEPADPVSEPGP